MRLTYACAWLLCLATPHQALPDYAFPYSACASSYTMRAPAPMATLGWRQCLLVPWPCTLCRTHSRVVYHYIKKKQTKVQGPKIDQIQRLFMEASNKHTQIISDNNDPYPAQNNVILLPMDS
jgi:hypothetical protein